jgi:UDP-N-acetyl-D-glucosamine dehydrogenase
MIKEISSQEALLEKIRTHTAVVGVVGLGYVGLPFAVEKAKVGYKVIGFDRSVPRVAQVNRGENYIKDVIDAELSETVGKGLIEATTDFARLRDVDVVVICVPTPLNKNLIPDLQYVEAVTQEAAKYLRPGQLISLESTTYPGTTDEIMLPILQTSGLELNKDFFLAHSPERVDPGNARYTTKNTNKVVGGVGEESLEVAVAFYSATIDHVVAVSSAKAAELVKVYENTFRAVNIALVNEITVLCDRMGLNVWEVLDAAFTKPFGIMPFYPGPGVGGHCIPLDPHYLEYKAKEYNFNTHFISLAGETNRRMPSFTVTKAARILNSFKKSLNGAKIVMLGMAYKANLDDPRESPAIEVFKLLSDAGAEVVFHDTWTPHIDEHGVKALTDDLIRGADLVMITTAHKNVDYARVVELAPAVLDTRYATKGIKNDKITML